MRLRAFFELARAGAFDWRQRAGLRSVLRAAGSLARSDRLARVLELDLVKSALVRARGPAAFSFLTSWRYLARTLSLDQRLDCALHHYGFEQEMFSSAYVDAVYRGEGLELWRSAAEDRVFSIRLMLANDNLFEGCLSVVAFVDHQRVCVLSFSYVDAALFGLPAGTTLFVTRKQSGRHPEELQAFARAFHHSSPPYFCVASLAGIARAIGAAEIAAVRFDAHPTYGLGDGEAAQTSYDEFWAVFGAAEQDQTAFRIPIPLEHGDLAEVSTKHRRRAKLRRQHWAEVTESACAALRGVIRRTFALIAALGFSAPAVAGDWKPVKIGGGGFLTGMDISPDGTTRCVRTDTYGAYCYDSEDERWTQVLTARTMPATDVAPGLGEGVYELRVAPSDPLRLYMAFSGYVFRSTDRGAHWTRTGFKRVAMDGNDPYRTSGEKLAVDPSNADVVVLGTQSDGLWLTTDGGKTWRHDGSVPKTGRITGIAFDASGGSSNGRTSTIYAASATGGVYRSTNAGESFAPVPGGPAKGVTHGVAKDGVYYAASAEGRLWKYAKGAWKDFTPAGGKGVVFHSIALDVSTSRLVAASESTQVFISPDRGETWQSEWYYETKIECPDAPWLCKAWEAVYFSNSTLVFDPIFPDRLWMAAGTAPWYATVPKGPPEITWTSRVEGIEQLVSNTVIVPPGGGPVVASWDFGLFRIRDPARAPVDYAPTPHVFGAAWHVDWASADPRFLVAFLCWDGPSQSSFSRDGGATWTLFPSMPVGNDCDDTWGWGGTGAAASPTSWIWVPSGRRAPYYTTDAGVSWHKLVLPGVPDDATDAGWGTLHFAYYLGRHIVSADRVKIGTYYLYHPIHGVFRSTDFAATWTLVKKGELVPFSGFNAKLVSVPGHAGHLFFTVGQQGDPRDPNPSPDALFVRSKDGGVTWSAIPRVKEVFAFGFGKPQSGGYPAIYIAGWVQEASAWKYGIWSSTDEGETWQRLGGEYALDRLDTVKTIDADKDEGRTVYIGFAGSGYARYELDEPSAPILLKPTGRP